MVPVLWLPLAAFVPLHDPPAVQLVGLFVADQPMVELEPAVILFGDTLIVTTGLVTVVPPPPVPPPVLPPPVEPPPDDPPEPDPDVVPPAPEEDAEPPVEPLDPDCPVCPPAVFVPLELLPSEELELVDSLDELLEELIPSTGVPSGFF